MATHQLGPETPRPFSVISEDHTKTQLAIPHIPEFELYSFGQGYENQMCKLIHKYLELGTDDNLCYVGQEVGSLAPLLQDKFCVLEPITTVVPGHIHYQESPSHKMVPIRISHVGAEEFFRDEAQKPPKFTKILLKDAVPYFTNPRETYLNIMRTVKDFGRILVVHRAAPMNTLPLFNEAKDRMESIDKAYMEIIQDLQNMYLDVQWEIECVPVVMSKMKWYAMLKQKYPPQMEVISNYEVRGGLRELSEGVLKYEGEMVEFMDRLLFISASHSAYCTYPNIQRFGACETKPFPGLEDLQLQMEVTPDLQPYVRHKLAKDRRDAQKLQKSEKLFM